MDDNKNTNETGSRWRTRITLPWWQVILAGVGFTFLGNMFKLGILDIIGWALMAVGVIDLARSSYKRMRS